MDVALANPIANAECPDAEFLREISQPVFAAVMAYFLLDERLGSAGILGGALLFSAVNAFQLWMQVLGVQITSDVAIMLPYLLTIAALAFTVNRVRQPAALNKPFERGDAYQRANRFLSIVKMPEGVLNFEKNIPDRDTLLLAPAATLVVREGFHPALVDLLLDAAVKIHGAPGLIQELHEFPSQNTLREFAAS